MRSFKKKINTLFKVGLDPLIEGVNNFNNPIEEIEFLAKERLKECLNCDKFKKEPVEFLKVNDERVPKLSGKMCDECGCTLSYKLRQSIVKCNKWKE